MDNARSGEKLISVSQAGPGRLQSGSSKFALRPGPGVSDLVASPLCGLRKEGAGVLRVFISHKSVDSREAVARSSDLLSSVRSWPTRSFLTSIRTRDWSWVGSGRSSWCSATRVCEWLICLSDPSYPCKTAQGALCHRGPFVTGRQRIQLHRRRSRKSCDRRTRPRDARAHR
jgi:hypothetical protein